jgi:hypothetical protein
LTGLLDREGTLVLQYLLDLVARLGHWSYIIIFVAAALECAAFFGLLVPGESLMLATGFFAQQGLLDLDAVIVVGILGAGILPRGQLAGSRALARPHRPDHRRTLRRGYNRNLDPAPAPPVRRGLRLVRLRAEAG